MRKPTSNGPLPSSFRDPSGFVFHRNGSIYRQINNCYKENYNNLVDSGLYDSLVKAELLIPHKTVNVDLAPCPNAHKVIQPALIPHISYPYEWCFSQLRDAALTTLEIQKKCLNQGMSLKDCNAYNIQFYNGKCIFIDTLSFEIFEAHKPWVAYRQFCQHFLAPLALMAYTDVRLHHLLRIYMDGIPLDLTSTLLPFRSRLCFPLLLHIHLHARTQRRYANKKIDRNTNRMSKRSHWGLIDSLEGIVKKLKWQSFDTEWANYYKDTNYNEIAMDHKKELIREFLAELNPRNVWDLGANTGEFSRIASNMGMQTIAFDFDFSVVEKNYLTSRNNKETNLLPLNMDLTNPSPAIGWQNKERMSLSERGPVDTVLLLAVIHHLAISNNLPLTKIAEFLSEICESLIIEFIPKSDSQAQKLLSSRKDIFHNYTQGNFEQDFKKFFTIKKKERVKDSERTLYLLEKLLR